MTALVKTLANTNLAAAGGAVVAMLGSQAIYGKVDLTMALNGAQGSVVRITAEPLTPSILSAVPIGGVGGALVVIAIPLRDKLRIDDVVGVVPMHPVCGIRGTPAVPLTDGEANFGARIPGIAAIGAFVAAAGFVVRSALKATMGARPDDEAEELGADRSELGLKARPEFGKGSQRF